MWLSLELLEQLGNTVPPVTYKPASELVRPSGTGWVCVKLETTGVHEPTAVSASSVDANRLPSSIEIDILNIHVIRECTTEVEQLIEVGFSVALCNIGGVLEAFDGIGLVGVENGIVQAGSSVRCNKPEIIEMLFATSLTRLELSVEQILARGVQGCQRSAGKSKNGEDGVEVHGCGWLC